VIQRLGTSQRVHQFRATRTGRAQNAIDARQKIDWLEREGSEIAGQLFFAEVVSLIEGVEHLDETVDGARLSVLLWAQRLNPRFDKLIGEAERRREIG
jgi:hypothetical protein